jgi:hypothetical protein
VVTPTRVLMRDGLDAPWMQGVESAFVGPRQFLRPNDPPMLVNNPYPAQPASVSIRVLSELSDGPTLQPTASAVQNQVLAQFAQDPGGGVIVSAAAPTSSLWAADNLPYWPCSVSMSGCKGLALDITGDGSGAVLVITLTNGYVRDYVVKIDFTGKRSITIPTGEVGWANGWWGLRPGTERFPYSSVTRVCMGFGYIPASVAPQVKVERLRLMADVASSLVNPVVTTGTSALAVIGTIQTGQYLRYDGGTMATVYDLNWRAVQTLPVFNQSFAMPGGVAPVSVAVAAGSPQPWLEVQFVTKGSPIIVPKPAPPLAFTGIRGLRGLDDGAAVRVTGQQAVTCSSGTFSDGGIYLEEPGRSAGIKMIPRSGLPNVDRGDRITVTGIMATDSNGERYVDVTSIDSNAAGSPIASVGATARTLCTSAAPDLMGLLLTVWGRVTHVEADGSYAYVDDGSGLTDGSPGGHTGIRMVLDDSSISKTIDAGTYLAVRGVWGLARVGTASVPAIRPRDNADISNAQ